MNGPQLTKSKETNAAAGVVEAESDGDDSTLRPTGTRWGREGGREGGKGLKKKKEIEIKIKRKWNCGAYRVISDDNRRRFGTPETL